MLELVDTFEELVANVKEYQKAVEAAQRPHRRRRSITPSAVHAWYYIPACNMVGASRFIGHKGMTKRMTLELYENSNVDGGKTERHLQKTGWFRLLKEYEPEYKHARSLSESLCSTGRLHHSARFNVLKETYDEQVRKMCRLSKIAFSRTNR